MLQKSGLDYIKKEDPSVVCLQETKTNPEDDAKWKEKLGNWPYAYFSCSVSKGRHGTAVLSRVKPVSVHYGLDDSGKHENDGRVIILEVFVCLFVCVCDMILFFKHVCCYRTIVQRVYSGEHVCSE